MSKIPVGILGATGMVGQRFIALLEGHPWLEVAHLASSGRSAGKAYSEACDWRLDSPIPERIASMKVSGSDPDRSPEVVFSALPGEVAGSLEEKFARSGRVVFSNASSHRMEEDVPLLMPEVNPGHAALVERQRKRRCSPGFIVANPNCLVAELVLALKPLQDAFGVERVHVVSFQAVSGAGYPGVPSWDVMGNVIPFIHGEEAKVEEEPLKILGAFNGSSVTPAVTRISAQCNRVPVREGHSACVSVEFARKADTEDVVEALSSFRPPREAEGLPSTPCLPVVVHTGETRPQPVLDAPAGMGMTVSVGRVRPCPLFHHKFFIVGHNTIRGAAGGAIHNAELMTEIGHIGSGVSRRSGKT